MKKLILLFLLILVPLALLNQLPDVLHGVVSWLEHKVSSLAAGAR